MDNPEQKPPQVEFSKLEASPEAALDAKEQEISAEISRLEQNLVAKKAELAKYQADKAAEQQRMKDAAEAARISAEIQAAAAAEQPVVVESSPDTARAEYDAAQEAVNNFQKTYPEEFDAWQNASAELFSYQERVKQAAAQQGERAALNAVATSGAISFPAGSAEAGYGARVPAGEKPVEDQAIVDGLKSRIEQALANVPAADKDQFLKAQATRMRILNSNK